MNKVKLHDAAAYQTAIQNPQLNLSDQDLQQAKPDLTPMGLPHGRAGTFAIVFRLTSGNRTWAVRCFKERSDDIKLRYDAISQWLQIVKHEGLFVDAQYIDRGILVAGSWSPIIKMEWVEGQLLNRAIESMLNDRPKLETLASEFRSIVGRLLILGMAHGDLQHGNMLVSHGKLKLIDYDGIYLPALAGLPSSNVGLPAYQHPERTTQDFSPSLDRFSAIVIYTALRSLIVKPSLWKDYSLDQAGEFKENCLFVRADYNKPEKSALFQDLIQIPEVRHMAERLMIICKMPFHEIPSLTQFIDGTFTLSNAAVTTRRPTASAASGTGASAPQPLPPITQPLVGAAAPTQNATAPNRTVAQPQRVTAPNRAPVRLTHGVPWVPLGICFLVAIAGIGAFWGRGVLSHRNITAIGTLWSRIVVELKGRNITGSVSDFDARMPGLVQERLHALGINASVYALGIKKLSALAHECTGGARRDLRDECDNISVFSASGLPNRLAPIGRLRNLEVWTSTTKTDPGIASPSFRIKVILSYSAAEAKKVNEGYSAAEAMKDVTEPLNPNPLFVLSAELHPQAESGPKR